MTKTIKLRTNDVWKDIKSSVKPACLTDLTIRFNVVLEIDDKLHEMIEDDAYLADKIFGHVSDKYKLAKADLAKSVEEYGELAQEGGQALFHEAKKACERFIELRLDAASQEIEKHSRAEIEKMLKDRKDKTRTGSTSPRTSPPVSPARSCPACRWPAPRSATSRASCSASSAFSRA